MIHINHDAKNIYECLGISDTRAEELVNAVMESLPDTNKPSEAIEVCLTLGLTPEEQIYLVYKTVELITKAEVETKLKLVQHVLKEFKKKLDEEL